MSEQATTIISLLHTLYKARQRVVVATDDNGYVICVEHFDMYGDVSAVHHFAIKNDATDEEFRLELLNICNVFASEIEDSDEDGEYVGTVNWKGWKVDLHQVDDDTDD